MVNERVEQLRTMRALAGDAVLFFSVVEPLVVLVVILDRPLPLFGSPVLSNLIENVDFIICCLNVVLSTFLNFQGHVAVVLEVFGKPNGREVSPA